MNLLISESVDQLEAEVIELRQRLASLERAAAERQREKDARHVQEELYHQVFDNMQEGFSLQEIILDENGQAVDFFTLDANAAYERHTGIKREAVIGRRILEVNPAADRVQIRRYGRVALTGEPTTFEYYSKTFNRFMRVRAFSPRRGLFATVFEDITQTHQTETELRDSEAKYRALFENEFFAIAILDQRDLRVLDANEAFLRLYGYTIEDLLAGITMRDISAEQDDSAKSIKQAIEHGTQFIPCRHHRKKDGSVFPVEIVGSPHTWMGRGVIFAIVRDISEREKGQADLLTSERRFRSLFEQTHDAVFILSLEGKHLLANQRAADMLGYTTGEILNLSVRDTSAELPDSQNIIGRLLGGENIPPYERLFRKKSGQVFPVEINVELVRDGEGQPQYIQSVVRDISQRKQVEETLRNAHTELEQRVQERTAELRAANQELETLIRTMAHDFRSPLRAMASYSYLLEENTANILDEDGRFAVQRVKDSSRRMNQMLDDLLVFMQLNRQPVNRRTLDLTGMAQSVFELLKPQEGTRPVSLILHAMPACQADLNMVQLLLTHLLGNALKFSAARPDALIEIGAQEGAYFVRDNGIGFDAQYADKIFAVFERLHRIDEYEGTGIGLAIAKRITERHGGRIWAQSQSGQGATVYFTLG